MQKKKRSDSQRLDSKQPTEITLLAEIAKLLRLQVRLNLKTLAIDRSQKDMILLLDSAGCGYAEIAELLDINPNSVGPVLSKSRG